MAENDKSISQLPERAELTGNELIPFAENGANGSIKSSLLRGLRGAEGKSAYQLAVEAGYAGTEAEYSALLAEVPEQSKRVNDMQTKVDGLTAYMTSESYLAKDYCVAAWDGDDLSPEAKESYGNPEILRQWDFFLIDTTDNSVETTTPVGKLMKNNLLRFKDGTFAPVVGITEEQRVQCDVALYLDAGGKQKYCDALGFDAAAFYGEYGMSRKLYDASGKEIGHILRPWETTETKYTIGLGRTDTVYLLDNVTGNSGKVWKGIFLKPAVWDGIDVSGYPLEPTAFSPCPVTTVGGKTRNFFYLYEGETNCKSSAGQNGLCTMFLNRRTYPRVNDAQQVNLMNWARANNAVTTQPYPFAEGGYHALNTFVTAQEILYGTKYLHGASLFGSGISSNDTCNNEPSWLANGGVRYKASNEAGAAWAYGTFGSTPNIYYSAAQQRGTFNVLLNLENPKEQCMESQMAASFARETGVAEGEEFEFYGATYWYKNVPGAKGLSEGDMNVRVYKRMSQTISAFDASGTATDFDIEVVLRMSLFGGESLAGDIFAYAGGGCEMVGTCVNPTDGSTGNPVSFYLQPDQKKWLRETIVNKPSLGTFDFENAYPKVGEATNLGDGYSLKRLSYMPWKLAKGGNIGTGECYYAYDRNVWSTTLNQRVRLAVRFRGYAHITSCSPRALASYYAASTATRAIGGFAQVLLGT